MYWNRRQLLAGLTGALAARTGATAAEPTSALRRQAVPEAGCPLSLVDYQPKSMLHVKETPVGRPRFPVIDFHTHLTFAGSRDGQVVTTHLSSPADVLKVMDRRGVAVMVNLTGGYGPALEEAVLRWQKPHPERFRVFVQPWFDRILEAGYPRILAEEIEKAARLGVRGIKVLKYLGLSLRERVDEGPLVRVDDPRFDEMWDTAGSLGLPVAIHTSDPEAFFLPTDRFNERFEELNAHPDWSFHGSDFPSDHELQEARQRVVRRHPRTTFVALHLGNSENLDYVSDCLRECPNMFVEFGARIGELGRQPRRSRVFFEEFQDRILFGTDAVPNGYETPQQIFGDRLYEIYYRFLETADEYFDYAPADVPPQGRWRIYGIDLPESILRKVYYDNAARLLGMQPLD